MTIFINYSNMNIKKNLKYLAIVIVVALAIIGLTVVSAFKLQRIGVLGSAEINNLMHLLGERSVDLHRGSPGQPSLLYPADPANDQILLGASHNVFVGKVLTQTGNKETEIGPRTQYQVQVIDSIKGELGDIVTVDMLGGYDNNGKPIFIEDGSVEGEDPLFQPGSIYLFATRYNTQEDWYTVIAHPNARKILSTDNSLPIQALRALADKDEKVKKFEAAYASEVLDKADIANNNTRNSFQSLPPEAKATAVARADAARAALGVGLGSQ